jgi:acyl-CoA synthetase (NDP forming)
VKAAPSQAAPTAEPPSLDPLFRPASVAFIGVSTDPARLTGRPLRILRQHGFTGQIQVVHPRATQIDGIPAVPAVADLDGSPDVAVVMLTAAAVESVVEQCGRKGMRHVVVLSSGFEETANGRDRAAALQATARRFGMGIVGPNSEGLWHVPARTILTFGSAAQRDELRRGPVAVLSQSGSIGASLMRRLNDSGLGADVFVSVGNETVLGVADYLNWIVDRADCRVVACFLEGLQDGRRFLDAAVRARLADVAVVVLQAGASEQGRAASASHTGKIATSAGVIRSLYRQAGVVQVDSLTELAAATRTLGGVRLPEQAMVTGAARRGVTVIGLSGGSRSIIADAASAHSVPLTTLSDTSTAALSEFIPDFGVVTNPVDPTGQVLSDPELFPRTIDVLASDPGTEALFVQYANGGAEMIRRHLPALGKVSRQRRSPVMVGCLLDELPVGDSLRRELEALGIGYASDPAQAVAELAVQYRWRAARPLPAMLSWVPPAAGGAAAPAANGALPPAAARTWREVAALVTGSGLRTPAEAVVPVGTGPADLSMLLDAAGVPFPVVVKASPDEVAHKSEKGLVRLGVNDATAAAATVAELAAVAESGRPLLVQEQVQGSVEMLVVLQEDKDFGPVLGVGLGGFFVELLAEISYVALPATEQEIARAIAATRLAGQLRGYRGHAATDPAVVSGPLAALGQAFAALPARPRLLELNPVLVAGNGELFVLDALVEN